MARLLALAVALLAPISGLQAPTDVVRWEAKSPQAAVPPGTTVRIELTADIEPGWHVYATTQPATGPQPLVIALEGRQPFELRAQDIVTSPPRIEDDPNFDGQTQFYEERATLTVPVTVKRTAAPGKKTVTLSVTFQACSGRICLRPATELVRAVVMIGNKSSSTKGGGR